MNRSLKITSVKGRPMLHWKGATVTKPKRYEEVALTRNIPEENLKRGDVAVVVEYIPHPTGGEEGAVLEIFNALGESTAVVAVPISAIEVAACGLGMREGYGVPKTGSVATIGRPEIEPIENQKRKCG